MVKANIKTLFRQSNTNNIPLNIEILELESCEYYLTSETQYREHIRVPQSNQTAIGSLKFFTLSSQPFKFELQIRNTPLTPLPKQIDEIANDDEGMLLQGKKVLANRTKMSKL